MVLYAQNDVRQKGPDSSFSLILPEEIYEIRKIWLTERGDWEDSIPKMYKEITGSDLNWNYDDMGIFQQKDQLILKQVCSEHQVKETLVQKLMEAERQTSGMNKRSSIFRKIDEILKEEWRDEEEVTKEVIEDLSRKNLVSERIKDDVLRNLEQKTKDQSHQQNFKSSDVK